MPDDFDSLTQVLHGSWYSVVDGRDRPFDAVGADFEFVFGGFAVCVLVFALHLAKFHGTKETFGSYLVCKDLPEAVAGQDSVIHLAASKFEGLEAVVFVLVQQASAYLACWVDRAQCVRFAIC